MSIAVALALGFVIGVSLRKIIHALLACLAAGFFTASLFVLLPYAWNGRVMRMADVGVAFVVESMVFAVLAVVGVFLGRRRARRGYGP